MSRIITISREFGSGGRELGRRLADTLKIEYYDNEIISEIAKHTSLSESYVKQVLENSPHQLFPITIGRSFMYTGAHSMELAQSIYRAQHDIISDLADKSDCVIVGRCADYILREKNPFRIYVYSDIESRVERCMAHKREDEKDFTEKDMRQRILSIDKNRARYYQFYTASDWGDKLNYDLCINTSGKVIKEIVPVIAKFFAE